MTTKPTIPADKATLYVVTNADWNLMLQEARYMQEVLAGVNSDKIPVSAISGVAGWYPNVLVNGGMEQWQRGPGPFTASGAWSADQWRMLLGGTSSVSIGQTGAIATGSQYAMSVNYTHAAGGNCAIFQSVENFAEFRGKAVTVSASVYTSANQGVIMGIADGVGVSYGSYSAAATLQTLSVTRTVDAAATLLQVQFIFQQATTTATLDNVILSLGSLVPPWVQTAPAEDVERCERYYQKANHTTRWRSSSAGETFDTGVYFRTRMAGTPTITVSVAGSRNNLTSLTVLNPSVMGCRVESVATVTATDSYSLADTLTAEFDV